MKSQILYSLFALFFVGVFTSCEDRVSKETKTGEIEFSLSVDLADDALKSVSQDSVPGASYFLIVTVEDTSGTVILDKEEIPLFSFGNAGNFVSRKIEMGTGEYRITEFMVVGPNGQIVFAAPRENSELAYLVYHPLPVYFSVIPGEITNVRPEVLAVGDHTPEDFGYVSFGIHVIYPLKFYAVVFIDNPLIYAPTRYTEAVLHVEGNDGWKAHFNMEAKVNELVIRGNSRMYVFTVKNEEYNPVKLEIPAEKLRATTMDNPLMIAIGSGSGQYELIIETDSMNTMDAMITDLDPNKNFAFHPLFEASFVSEPVLTVMRTKKSLMYINLRKHLPEGARINKVELILTFKEDYGMYDDSTFILSDLRWYGGVLRQIIEPWNDREVTWANQPSTIEVNQVMIDYMPWVDFDKRIYDVTSLFVPLQEIAAPNYGFMFSQYPDDAPGGAAFASSDYRNPMDRPRFKVYYTLPVPTSEK